MPFDPSAAAGPPENPRELEAVPELVQQRMALREQIGADQGVPPEEVQQPPLSHREMTRRFYESHDMEDPAEREKLARFTLRFDIV